MDSDFGRFVWAFWWLIFPIMGFAFGAFGMWMGYRTHRDRMDVIKTLAAQGKDPAEVAKMMGGPGPAADPYWGGYPARGYWGWGWGGYWGRFGPYREWRRFIIFVCLAVGFGVASQYADFPGTEHAFTVVAIIMGVLAAGSFCFAVLSSIFAANARKHEDR